MQDFYDFNASQKLRICFNFLTLGIFIFQAKQSVNKYLEYPVVIQKSEVSIDQIEKPSFYISAENSFLYDKAKDWGYSQYSTFMAGMIDNSSVPTWRGEHRNSSFKQIFNDLFVSDFSQVNVDTTIVLAFLFYQGLCLKTVNPKKELTITGKKKMRVFIIHSTTDEGLTNDQTETTAIDFGPTSNDTFDYSVYEIYLEVHDNTIFEGSTCVDYRNQDMTYGDCIYKAYKNQILSR